MSDSFITLVPLNVSTAQVKELSLRAIDWLIDQKIIDQVPTDCVLGQGLGYAPGINCKSIFANEDLGLKNLKINGVQLKLNHQVFDSGKNELEQINCPKCSSNNIASDWGEAIEAWNNEESSNHRCIGCGYEDSITNYEFIPGWAFGEFGLTFWNWPELKLEFLGDLKRIINKDLKIIYGRL